MKALQSSPKQTHLPKHQSSMDPSPAVHSDKAKSSDGHQPSSDYAPYPKLDPNDVAPHRQAGNWGTFVMGSSPSDPSYTAGSQATTMPPESNPYVSPSPAPARITMDSVRDALGRWGKRVGEKMKEAEDIAGNVWQHLKTGPSVTDAALGRIAQGTKVLAEGGYEKIFQQTFETTPDEQLQKSYACYLSTSAGPVMGILYLSTAKLAFCSDSPLSYKVGDQTEWSYYKVIIPLHQLRAVNPSISKDNPAEKYIQVISVDNHEFWFMGFVNYDGATTNLQEAMHGRGQQTV